VFLEIVRATEGTGLGVTFDTGNPLVQGDDPFPPLRHVARRVVSIDANDSKTRGRFEFCVSGKGLVPFAEVFGFLKREAGYDGWISVEEYSRTRRSGVPGGRAPRSGGAGGSVSSEAARVDLAFPADRPLDGSRAS
jgi:sugar phosphate isomerase/epimerase